MANTPKIAETLFDKSIRVSQIIWLAANCDSPCDALTDLLNEEDAGTLAKLLGLPTSIFDADGSEREMHEYVTEALSRKGTNGFLVCAETPIPTYFTKGGHGFSWGLYTTHWFYTDALDDSFVSEMVKWRDGVIAKKRKKISTPTPGESG
jgi:hypothetical protein